MTEMAEKVRPDEYRRFALIALGAQILEKATTATLFTLRRAHVIPSHIPAVPVAAAVYSWIVPLVIVLWIEKRDLAALGWIVERRLWPRYAIYALVGLVVPLLLVGIDRDLFIDLLEQVIYIGVAEEVFSRGYLTRRLCDWLGRWQGLVLSALIFGLCHLVSLVSQHGLAYPMHDLMMFGQTFIGGLLLGYIFLRAGNIVPGAIVHVAGNLYLGRLITLFGN